MAATKTKPRGAIPDKIMRDAIMLELAASEEVRLQNGQVKTFRKARLLAMAMVNAAIKGDAAMAKIVVDRSDGKLPNVIVGAEDAPPIQHEHVHTEKPAEPAVNYAELSLEELIRAQAGLNVPADDSTKH